MEGVASHVLTPFHLGVMERYFCLVWETPGCLSHSFHVPVQSIRRVLVCGVTTNICIGVEAALPFAPGRLHVSA